MATSAFTLPRRVEPEWLDSIPAGDPRAVHSRGDLQRVNAVMQHAAVMARLLKAAAGAHPPKTILDLGSGDGTLMLAVARHLSPRWTDVTVRLLDRQNLVTAQTIDSFVPLRWRAEPVAADLAGYLERGESAADAITANLVLHHFNDAELSLLLRRAAERTPMFIACEPRRARHALAFSKMLWAIGANDVTRHDAPASVRAGFRSRELSALWPDPERWILQEGGSGLFSHYFAAVRP